MIAVLREIYRLLKAAPLRTLWIRWRVRAPSARLYLYPKVHCFASRAAKVFVDDQLRFGIRWEHHPYLPSQFILRGNAVLRVKGYFRFLTGCYVLVDDGATLTLGKDGYINAHTSIVCTVGVQIGDNVAIASRVLIQDSDFHQIDPSKPMSAPIVIGNKVWIGDGAMILKGVTIGEGAVVAAGAVVARDVPPNTLVGGVPAKVIRENVAWE